MLAEARHADRLGGAGRDERAGVCRDAGGDREAAAGESGVVRDGGGTGGGAVGRGVSAGAAKGLERYGDRVRELPWGAGSGMRGERAGHFFCVRWGIGCTCGSWVGEPIIERDSLTCLRTIACSEQTERVMSEALRAGLMRAWERARRDIHEEWMFYTDPLNSRQPKVRPAMRRRCGGILL